MIKKTIALLAAVIFCVTLCGCHLAWRRYTDKKNGFSFSVPRWWQESSEHPEVAAMFLSPIHGKKDRFRENIVVTSADLISDALVDMFWENNKKAIMLSLPGRKSGFREGDFFAGLNRGRYLIFESKTRDFDLTIKSVAWFKDSRVYSVTCTAETKAYHKYEKMFDTMLKSFRFNPPPRVKPASSPAAAR